jgi:hypothetical protein
LSSWTTVGLAPWSHGIHRWPRSHVSLEIVKQLLLNYSHFCRVIRQLFRNCVWLCIDEDLKWKYLLTNMFTCVYIHSYIQTCSYSLGVFRSAWPSKILWPKFVLKLLCGCCNVYSMSPVFNNISPSVVTGKFVWRNTFWISVTKLDASYYIPLIRILLHVWDQATFTSSVGILNYLRPGSYLCKKVSCRPVLCLHQATVNSRKIFTVW